MIATSLSETSLSPSLSPSLSIDEEILSLLEHLGIDQAHFGARVPQDWQSLVKTHPETMASLTLLCPRSVDPGAIEISDSRLLVIAGDQGDEAGAAGAISVRIPSIGT